MPEIRKLNVFLCHASQDKNLVRKLSQELDAAGWISPWLDEEKILPGQDWNLEIEKAVETTDTVIVCLSNKSVTKEGFIQKELRFALDIAEEKPEGTIFIIPLRLEDCSAPRRLKMWQYVDYFPEQHMPQAFSQLLKSLKIRADAIGIKSGEPPNRAINPFIFGRSVVAKEFYGRATELKRIANHLASGQSVAIIGQPHVGKTSLLQFVADADARRSLFGEEFEKNFFVFLDLQATQDISTQAEFWRYVLSPLYESEFVTQCHYAAAADYNNFALERVFGELKRNGRKLILLLDEFDTLPAQPVLNNNNFYSGLRKLAMHSGGFVLAVAARHTLEQLNLLTQGINPLSAHYFNYFIATQLGALKSGELLTLLDQGSDHITAMDRMYIEQVSGRHPYLAQTAAAMLWDAREEGLTGKECYISAGYNLYHQTRPHFADTWHFWSKPTRKTILTVALTQIFNLLTDHTLKVADLADDFDNFTPELVLLQSSGLLTQNGNNEWSVAQDALLWWMADELRGKVRDKSKSINWSRSMEIEDMFTSNTLERLDKTIQEILEVLGKGTTTLIEKSAKRFADNT